MTATPAPALAGSPVALRFNAGPELSAMYLLSPFVWTSAEGWHVAIRAVPNEPRAADKVARIHLGHSADGIEFDLDDTPAIAPRPDGDDQDGCEDPTVVTDGPDLRVFYSGWNQQRSAGQLLVTTAVHGSALGADRRRVLPQPSRYLNAKEAVLLTNADGRGRLLFEHAVHGRSAIGAAWGTGPDGPWTAVADPLVWRRDWWDSHHLSPGAVVATPSGPLLFYNGANEATQWRVGWARFNHAANAVVERGDAPIVVPPPVSGADTDIAFCSSVVRHGDRWWLYYTVSDKDAFRVEVHCP